MRRALARGFMNDEQDHLLKTSDARDDRSRAIDEAAERASEPSVQGNEHAESDDEKNVGRFSAPGKERTKPDAEEAVSGDAETSCTDVGTVSSRTRAERAEAHAMGQAVPSGNDGSQPKRRAVDLPYERRRQVVAWAFVAAWAGFIFWASAHTGMQLDYGNDLLARAKAWLSSEAFQVFGYTGDISPVGHFCEYFVFGLLVARAAAFGASER